jgi:tRNA(adenine34) deaminase
MRDKDEIFMRMAIQAAEQGIPQLEYPFGCCIALDEEHYVCAGNHSLTTADPTSHAEMNAIREWCRIYGPGSLKGAVLYATSEPCLMCLGAINWAQIPRIVCGTTLERCMQTGFMEAEVDSAELVARFPYPVSLERGILAKECEQLFVSWNRKRRLIDLWSRPAGKST